MENLVFCLTLLSLCCCILAVDKVPVLLWSPTRPLSDLPPAYAGNSIDSSSFHQKYINPLTSKPGQNLVAFIQDKLSLDDFTKHADVYNPYSDGGAFKNVKGFMDEHFSADLPSVHSPVSVLDSLKKDFAGRTHQVTSPAELGKLSLDKQENYLIIVLLPSIKEAEEEEKAFSNNDDLIGQMVKQLEKMAVQYTAIYTGKTSKNIESDNTYKGRHLLAADNKTATFMFVNYTNEIYFYSRGIEIVVLKDKTILAKMKLPMESDKYDSNGTSHDNNTAVFQLSFPSTKPDNDTSGEYNATFRFVLVKKNMDWTMLNFSVSVYNKSSNEVSVNEQMMDLRELAIRLPVKFSYHCSKMTLFPRKKAKNETYAIMTIYGFQFQPFGIKRDQFGDGWDCVGYFTTPILMGLLPVGLFVFILFCGMYMLAGLSTMDRFDDPKGKTITVNVQE